MGLDQAGRCGAGGGQAHLLAEHRLDGHLRAVELARDPQPRQVVHEWGEDGVLGERLVDRDRVAVGVEQAAGALGGRGQVAGVGQREGACDVARGAIGKLDADHPGTVG
jgi:hypothetical protein